MQRFKLVLGAIVAGLAFTAGHTADAAHAEDGSRTAAIVLPTAKTLGTAVSVDPAVRANLLADGSVDAIVTFEFADTLAGVDATPADLREARQEFSAAERQGLAHPDIEVLKSWANLPVAFVQIGSEAALNNLLANPDVLSITTNKRLTTASNQHLNVIRQPAASQAGHRGAGVYVAVLDTGINHLHPDFGNCPQVGANGCKVVGSFEVAPNDNVLDSVGHGSNVGSIVLKVAPGAKLISYDVFRADGFTDYQLVSTALNHLVGLKSQGWPVVAANMSIGGGAYSTTDCSSTNSAYAAAFTTARNAGIIPVVSSSNSAKSGAGAYGVGSPGCVASALTVGATHDANVGTFTFDPNGPDYCVDTTTFVDKVACFSQTGPALDLLAPGTQITGGGWVGASGTSMAAPHVAGAVAVLAAAKPTATIGQIESALVTTGRQIVDQRYATTITRKRLDVAAAVQALLGSGGGADTTAPSVGSVVENFDGPVSASGTIVKISWSATDANGIAEYALYARSNGGQWTRQSTAATATSARFTLAFGTKYEFAVQARDPAGNWSTHSYSPALTPGYSDDRSWSLTGWTRYNWNSAFGGTYVTSNQANASITHTFTGRDVGLVASRFSTAGRAHIYCDNAFKGTVDLYSATLQARELAYWCRFAQAGTHTMKVVVEGTAGRPRVDVDAFVRLS
jgi:subtilisin family serine protease